MKPKRTSKSDLFLKKNAVAVSLFLTVFFIMFVMLTLFYARKVAPFGSCTLCSMDGFSQYYPMLQNFSRALKKGELFYSFSGGLGYNLWVQSAYYTNSPLWLPVLLSPESLHISMIHFTILLRFCLAGFCFCLVLNKRKKAEPDTILPYTALSVAYGMSAYMIAFINQFMWTDAVVLLPLVAFGIEKICRGQKPTLYLVSLFLTIFSCFYIAYMVCIFAILYFLIKLSESQASVGFRTKRSLTFAFSSLLAGGCSAVSLIPVALALQKTKASSLTLQDSRLYHHAGSLLRNFLPGCSLSLEFGAANVYCGMITLALVVAVLCHKSIPLKGRLLRLGFIISMLLSFEWNVADYVWHGFHFPNQLPCRQSFILIFFLLNTASEFFVYYPRPRRESKNQKLPIKTVVCSALATVLLAEVLLNACTQFMDETWISPIENLNRDAVTAEKLHRYQNEQDDFFRCEFSSSKKNNPGLQFGYNGIAYYSSTMSGAFYDLFRRLDMPYYAQNVSTHYTASPICNALFAVRYYVLSNGSTVIKNNNCLPLAFCADKAILSFTGEGLSGSDFTKALWQTICANECTVSQGTKQLQKGGMKITGFSSSRIKGRITCEKDCALFTSIFSDGGWHIRIDGKKAESKLVLNTLFASELPAGTHEIELHYTPPGFTAGLCISLLCWGLCLLLKFRQNKRQFPILPRRKST